MSALKKLAGLAAGWKRRGLRFRELFRWLSSSVSQVAKSQPSTRISLVKPSDKLPRIEV
jgi:uncharacterized protein YegL